jgi:hypothetical protein
MLVPAVQQLVIRLVVVGQYAAIATCDALGIFDIF